MRLDGSEQSEGRGFLGPRIVAITLLILSLIGLYQAFQIRQGAGYSAVGTTFFPLIVVVGLVGLSLSLLLRTTLWPDRELAEQAVAEEAMTHWPTVGLTALILALYAFALNPLGYIVATTLFFPAVARTLDSRRPGCPCRRPMTRSWRRLGG